MSDSVIYRKQDHLTICLDEEVTFCNKTTLFEDVEIVHCALPELSLDAVETSTWLFEKPLQFPFVIGAMSGGVGRPTHFNQDLARAAEETGVGMCLGSIRPMLERPALTREFMVRDQAPTTLLVSNIGAGQIRSFGAKTIVQASRDIGADAVYVHLNAGMELIQPRGDRDFRGQVDAIAELVETSGATLPVGVKETGMGLSQRDGKRLRDCGVKVVETGGAGGTSWAAVESFRAEGTAKKMGALLWDFGIPSAVSCVWMVQQGFCVVAGGGLRNGLDLARALALGASAGAMARPVLQAHAQGGTPAVMTLLEEVRRGLEYVMVCCGAGTLDALRSVPMVWGDRLTRWVRPSREDG